MAPRSLPGLFCNGHVQRRPAFVARPRVADVMAVVRFCHEHDLPASVQAGGTVWRRTPSVTGALSSTSPP
jgi:FAD/FMN-containing dehydrogenase